MLNGDRRRGLYARVQCLAIKLIELAFSVGQIGLLNCDLLAQSFHLPLQGRLHHPSPGKICR